MFKNIAKLTKERRLNGTNMSQSELSHSLGLKNGQFISSISRGLCSLPLKRVNKFCELTDTPIAEVKAAYMSDCSDRFDKCTQL